MGIHEPCQVRKEAALSGSSHVPQGCLGRANCLSNAYGCLSTKGARQFHTYTTAHPFIGMGFLFGFGLLHILSCWIDFCKKLLNSKIVSSFGKKIGCTGKKLEGMAKSKPETARLGFRPIPTPLHDPVQTFRNQSPVFFVILLEITL
jgi:hypothetical protein